MSRYKGDLDDMFPNKCESNVSILTVYDTWGLEIAQLFLIYLVHKQTYNEQWLSIYLNGCMIALGLENEGHYRSILHRIMFQSPLISLELIRLENNKTKMLGELVDQSLPLELVAKITGSRRLAKTVTIV